MEFTLLQHRMREWRFVDRWPAKPPQWRCSCGEEFSHECDVEAHLAIVNQLSDVGQRMLDALAPVDWPPSPSSVDWPPSSSSVEWLFPSARYDYARARVGDGRRIIEVDADEVALVLKNFASARPETPP